MEHLSPCFCLILSSGFFGGPTRDFGGKIWQSRKVWNLVSYCFLIPWPGSDTIYRFPFLGCVPAILKNSWFLFGSLTKSWRMWLPFDLGRGFLWLHTGTHKMESSWGQQASKPYICQLVKDLSQRYTVHYACVPLSSFLSFLECSQALFKAFRSQLFIFSYNEQVNKWWI